MVNPLQKVSSRKFDSSCFGLTAHIQQVRAELSRIAAHYLVSFARFCFSFGHQAGGDGGKGFVVGVHAATLRPASAN